MYDQKADYRKLYDKLTEKGFVVFSVFDEEEWNDCTGFDETCEVVLSVDCPTISVRGPEPDYHNHTASIVLTNGEGPGQLVCDYTLTGDLTFDGDLDRATMEYFDENTLDSDCETC